ncbi:MAG TPA: hypothetical protein VGD14_16320, partial [bacterium]
QSNEDRAISNYLLAFSLKLQGKNTKTIDAELERLCAGEFETGWSFDEIENWLKDAEISSEVKDYIREKTELVKKHRK